jgi:hypothetical protein
MGVVRTFHGSVIQVSDRRTLPAKHGKGRPCSNAAANLEGVPAVQPIGIQEAFLKARVYPHRRKPANAARFFVASGRMKTASS